MNFATAMSREGSVKTTENGAFAYNSAGQGALLDLFAQIGSLRSRTEEEIISKFKAAFAEDRLLATKMMFYGGDIRNGGLGERRTFRICLRWLAQKHPAIVLKNIELVPYYNRFDSLFELIDTPCEDKMWNLVASVLAADVKAAKQSKNGAFVPASLLAKWMPSENTSSAKTRKLAHRAISHLHLTPRSYRKMLSALRKHINVVERRMSAGEWGAINYSQVPSYAMHNYGSAFAKHDHERFDAYLKSVDRGEQKIHSSVMYPYDLVKNYIGRGCYYGGGSSKNDVVEAQWKALPNYLDKPMNAVVMADVSDSMFCEGKRPIASSIGLAIYFAQHNTGLYHNKYMTFTNAPHFVDIREGASLHDNIIQVMCKDVGYNTNLSAAFDYILRTAVDNGVPNSEMPKALIVISDMEIDEYMRPGAHWDFIQTKKAQFAAYGYDLPKIILWNVEARNDTYLSQSEDVIFLSGQSASTFKNLCQNLNGVTAYDMMLRVLNGEAYAKVTI